MRIGSRPLRHLARIHAGSGTFSKATHHPTHHYVCDVVRCCVGASKPSADAGGRHVSACGEARDRPHPDEGVNRARPGCQEFSARHTTGTKLRSPEAQAPGRADESASRTGTRRANKGLAILLCMTSSGRSACRVRCDVVPALASATHPVDLTRAVLTAVTADPLLPMLSGEARRELDHGHSP